MQCLLRYKKGNFLIARTLFVWIMSRRNLIAPEAGCLVRSGLSTRSRRHIRAALLLKKCLQLGTTAAIWHWLWHWHCQRHCQRHWQRHCDAQSHEIICHQLQQRRVASTCLCTNYNYSRFHI